MSLTFGLYERFLLPRLIDAACGSKDIDEQRGKVVPRAKGAVLEIGVGPGHNLAHYRDDQVDRLWALEPAAEMIALAKKRAAPDLGVEFLESGAEEIPLDDASVDTVVLTYTLCTIPDTSAALREMHRVLRPDGQMLFCEHGRSPDASVHRWQRRIEPLWKRIGGGCHLTRDVPELLGDHGFAIDELDTAYLPGPRPMTWNTWGRAAKS